ncbi:MAG: N-acetylmuramoyl-L-alanine amidase [Clostridiales bacterium]|jgi:N-acetylmuramoyl-L-alanine amidase CwlA|nr:N-acetylmuramoyl-L-alanine amidase [Clostridiales bacterium]
MEIENSLLTLGTQHGRSGNGMTPKGIAIHCVGNPGSSPIGRRNYFESGAGGNCTSAHYIIGLGGEILLCIPETECAAHAGRAYAACFKEACKTNNSTLIGIECCHAGSDGKFNKLTENSLIELCVEICKRWSLDPTANIMRHYDATGKACPKYYVENPSAWNDLKTRIAVEYAMSAQSRWETVENLAGLPQSQLTEKTHIKEKG